MRSKSLQGQYVLLGTLCCKQRKKKHLDKKKNIISPYCLYLGALTFLKYSTLTRHKRRTFGNRILGFWGLRRNFVISLLSICQSHLMFRLTVKMCYD